MQFISTFSAELEQEESSHQFVSINLWNDFDERNVKQK